MKGPETSDVCPDENTLVAFASGALPVVDAARVEEHLDGCGVCFSLVAELARADPDESDPTRMLSLHGEEADGAPDDESEVKLWGLGRVAAPGEDDDEGERTLLGPLMPPAAPTPAAPPTQLGRYTVLHRLGAGAMGVVYAAVDRELGRRVALKLIEATGPDALERGARLLREAQALARLAHPHVVTVFDAGRVDGQVFISTELVAGTTLQEWLRPDADAPRRPWQEILVVFRQAGAGLAAAHAAGIIHRDFKPSNVLVDEQGRARVVDFGLARAFDPVRDDAQTVIRPLPSASTTSGVLARSGADLSRSDVIAGTPAYMAPEQYDGLGDARIDQFAFCVALFDALFGRRPFEGRTAEQLLARINTGVPPEIPARGDTPSPVPRWLTRIVLRGLSRDPDQRFPGMDELLRAIEAAQRRGGIARRVAIASGLVTAVALAGVAVVVHERPHPCDDAQSELAGLWDEPTQAILEAKIATVGARFGGDAWTHAHPVLDAWTATWTDTAMSTCRASVDDPELVVRDRQACIELRRVQLRAVTESWAVADAGVVEHLVDGAQWLTPADACTDAPPFDPQLFDLSGRVAVQQVRDTLVGVRAAAATGAADRAATLGRAALASATALGDDHVLVGEANLALGEAMLDAGAITDGNTHIDAALQSSIARDDATMLRGAAAAAARGAVAAGRDRTAVLQLVAIGRAAIGRTENGDVYDDAADALDRAEAAAHLAAGEGEPAMVLLATALDRRIARHGEQHLRTADVLVELGHATLAARHQAEALEHQRRALAIREGRLGGAHPRVAASCSEVASALVALGRNGEARTFAERALSIHERAFGSQDPRVADALSRLGAIEAELGHIDLALASHRRALAIREQSADVAALTVALDLLGSTLVTLGRWDEADAVLHRALDLGTTGTAVGPLEVATTRFLLGRTAHGRGDFTEAIPAFTAALETRRMHDDGTPSAAITQVWLARAQRDSGDLEHAFASAQAALERLEPPVDPDAWAHARLVVADVHWAQGETGLALGEVTEAITVLRGSAVTPPSAVAMLEAWRTARSTPGAQDSGGSDDATTGDDDIAIDP